MSRRGAGERGQCDCGVRGVLDVGVAAVEGLGAGDDDEEADHSGGDGADDDVDALELPVARQQLLVDGVGLDEGESPGRERRGEGGRGDEDRVALERQVADVCLNG
jgi:hypothetical protein